MRVISTRIIRDYIEAYPDTEQHLKSWLDEAKKADWKTPAEIKELYRNASILKSGRVVFNIRGNHYRLVVAIAYKHCIIYIKFLGTHQEYDSIDADTVEIEND